MGMFDELGMRHGTDKSSLITIGKHFDEFSKEGKPVKGHNYLHHYEQLLGHRRQEKLRILEIGTQHGYGMLTFRDCFPDSVVYGIDICPPNELDCLLQSGPKLYVGDATDVKVRDDFLNRNEIQSLDIIIDDASHQSVDQLFLLAIWYPFLSSRGTYVIEDLECCYNPYFGGDELGGMVVSTLFKTVRDCLKLSTTKDDKSQYVASVHVYSEGIAFIEKGN